MKMMMMYLYRKWGKLDLALQLLEEARADAKQAPQFLISLEYERALMHFLSAEWPQVNAFPISSSPLTLLSKQVIELLVPFQSKNTIVGYKTYSCYMLGLANEMLFQHERAVENFKRVTELARKGYDYDEFADRRARKYLAGKGMRLFERKFFTAMLHSEASRHADALDSLDGASSVAETPEDNACIACLRGFSLLKTNDIPAARKCYEEALAAEKQIKAETWVIPHSLLGMGDVHAALKQWDEAEKYYKKAKGFSGYDFSQLSQWRAMRSLDKVAEARKAK
jgi:tetratricopeptide (TPR) repeat protein